MENSVDFVHMSRALELALEAASMDEVPVGAVVTDQTGTVIGFGHNRRETDRSPLAHAEMLALQMAAQNAGRWRLIGCTLYVTLEPCVMCAGALVLSRVDRVVFGARDSKAGAVASLYQILSDARLNHRPTVTEGIRGAECSQILSDFFKKKRI